MDIRPDWNEIALRIGSDKSPDQLNGEWLIECQSWLGVVANKFGEDYQINETQNFLIMSNETSRYVELFSSFLERTLKRILTSLDGIASDEGYGKHVAMIFQDVEKYYSYVEMFYPEEGEFGLSSGMYINEGYGHFVFPSQDFDYAEPIAVHELTHACLSHLPLPLWVNEGLAVLMEDVLTGNNLYIDKEIVLRHQQYWNENTIQDFWSGDSFQSSDEGQELSYHLAHILIKNISGDFPRFVKFVNHTHFNDAGESAAVEVFDVSLRDIAASFLGEGSWKPARKFELELQPA